MNIFGKNLKSKKVLIFGVLALVCVVCATLVFTFVENATDFSEQGKNLYFLNSSTNEIVPEKRNVEKENDFLDNEKKNEYVNAIMEEFLKGPETATLTDIFPENLNVLWCKFIEQENGKGIVEINFSKEYNGLSESQELACRGAIVKTFTELDFITGVDIIVEGEKISRDNGESVGEMQEENFKTDPVIEPYKTDTKIVKLYFSDEQAMGLCVEERAIQINEKQSVETKIVEELIKGPENEKLVQVVPSETKINKISTEEGGICYVDLSNDFISQHNGGSTGEILTIYSIVNSLTELEEVEQVQFLIDGEKKTSLAGHVDFSKPFERDENSILKD